MFGEGGNVDPDSAFINQDVLDALDDECVIGNTPEKLLNECMNAWTKWWSYSVEGLRSTGLPRLVLYFSWKATEGKGVRGLGGEPIGGEATILFLGSEHW